MSQHNRMIESVVRFYMFAVFFLFLSPTRSINFLFFIRQDYFILFFFHRIGFPRKTEHQTSFSFALQKIQIVCVCICVHIVHRCLAYNRHSTIHSAPYNKMKLNFSHHPVHKMENKIGKNAHARTFSTLASFLHEQCV